VKFAPFIFFILFLAGCKKDREQQQGGYVNVSLYSNDPSFFPLQVVGGWAYYPANNSSGLKGLIIYRNATDQFSAFDRACPYHLQNACALLEVLNDNTSVIDSCCMSRFQIFDGQVLLGPATTPMIQYRTTFNGSVLHIFN